MPSAGGETLAGGVRAAVEPSSDRLRPLIVNREEAGRMSGPAEILILAGGRFRPSKINL
jgi:hypothetical protein